MKTRHDFVSNSSSSSFICTREDLDAIEVYGDECSLTLRQLIEQNWRKDVEDYYDGPSLSAVSFIPDDEFSRRFSHEQWKTLPASAMQAYVCYVSAYKAAQEARYEERSKAWNTVNHLEKCVAAAIYYALEKEWHNVNFVEVIASDEPHNDDSDESNDEECMRDSFSCLKDPKFYRVYSNH